MALVSVEAEIEVAAGWEFRLSVGVDDRSIRLHLSWADYEHWSMGSIPPARVAEGVVRYIIDRRGEDALRERFDASLVRRLVPQADEELPRML